MASLALIASMLFIFLICIGPFTYLISTQNWVPIFIRYLLGLICGSVGIWAVLIPISIFQVLGFINILIAFKALLHTNKKAQA